MASSVMVDGVVQEPEILLILLLSLSHQATTLGQQRFLFRQIHVYVLQKCSSEEINRMCDLRRRWVLMDGSGVFYSRERGTKIAAAVLHLGPRKSGVRNFPPR